MSIKIEPASRQIPPSFPKLSSPPPVLSQKKPSRTSRKLFLDENI